MDYEIDKILLRYEARSQSSDVPRLQLLILKQGNAVFFRTKDTLRDKDAPDRFLSISDEAMDSVRRILSEERLYRLGSLELPAVAGAVFHTYDFFFAGDGHMVAYQTVNAEDLLGKEECPKLNYLFEVMGRLGQVLIPKGVPVDCFMPGWTASASVVHSQESPVIDTFTVYDFQTAKAPRMLGSPETNERLERYAFLKHRDGTFSLEVQVGWLGSTGHWDGAGNAFPLPDEWFHGSCRSFLEKLAETYPAFEYGFSPEELAACPGLMTFLELH